MRVSEAMSRNVVSVGTGTTFRALLQLMHENHVSGLPVIDESGRVLGVVTKTDLIVKGHRADHVGISPPFTTTDPKHESERRAEGCVAGELMTAPALTVDEDADLRAAARLMSLHHVGRIPVTKDGTLTGVVSRSDVLRVFLRPDDEIRDEVRRLIRRTAPRDANSVDVRVRDGVVALTGTVGRRSTQGLIKFHVDRLDGVASVRSELLFDLDDVVLPQMAPAPVGPVEMNL